MKIEIVSEKENPLLKRKEMTFRIVYKGATPTFKDTRKELISKLKSNEKLTIVDSVRSEFGSTVATGYAKIYEDEKALDVEPQNRLTKNFEGKKKKKASAEEEKPAGEPAEKPAQKPKEEKPAEKPKEEKTEEKPEEKPKEGKPAEKPKEKKSAEKPAEAEKTEKKE